MRLFIVLTVGAVVLSCGPLSQAQVDYATITMTRDGNGGSQDWNFWFPPQDVISFEVRYRATNVNSVSPEVTYRCVSAVEGNAAVPGENWMNDNVIQPENTDWVTATFYPGSGSNGSTNNICGFTLLIDDHTTGSGDQVGLDVDYIKIYDGTATVDYPLQDDGSRIWTSWTQGAWAWSIPHGEVIGGTYGTVTQLDLTMNGGDENAGSRYYWEDIHGTIASTTFEWTWRTVPGDATDALDIALWFQNTSYGWYNPPGCWWGYYGGNPLTQPPLDWETRQCTLQSGVDYIGLSFDLSDSPFSGGLVNTLSGVQIDTMAFTDGATTIVVHNGEPDPNAANTGSVWTDQPYTGWDHLASFSVEGTPTPTPIVAGTSSGWTCYR